MKNTPGVLQKEIVIGGDFPVKEKFVRIAPEIMGRGCYVELLRTGFTSIKLIRYRWSGQSIRR
jgi:hypothetical protein